MRHDDDRFRPSALLTAALATAVGAVGTFLAVRTIVRHKRHFDLEGKTAVVTGGSRGIGLAIAKELTQRGAKLVICARDEAELHEAQEQLERLGGDVLSVVADVTQQDEIANVLQQARTRFGAIDVLINNAGMISVGPASHMTLADYRDAMDTNFEGPLLFMLGVMPEMRRRGSGRIVNVASFGGKIAAPHLAPYAASKFALVGLSESLRAELVDDNVYVTTVCPGLVRSGSSVNAVFKGQHEKERAWFQTGDNAPVISITPQRLAKQIVNALQAGDAELIAPCVAKLQVALHGLSGGVSSELAGLANRLLPGRNVTGDGDEPRRGRDVAETADPVSAKRQRRAERENNQTS